MNVTSRPLRQSKALSAAEVAKRTIVQSGLSPSAMSRWAEINVIWLLNGKPSRVRERVTWIVDACQQVIRLDQQLKLSTTPGAKDTLFREVSKTMKDLHSRVATYRCVPLVRYTAEPDRCFDVQYQFLAASEGAKPECVAVAWLMDHIHAVHRIRRCRHAECRKWFFAVTDHQKYCGDRCRKRDAAQGESFKEKRRIYMRKYRSEEPERNARSLRLARGESK
jgi:hypothetical protein